MQEKPIKKIGIERMGNKQNDIKILKIFYL